MNDKRLDIYLDAVTYIALKSRANDVERSVSQHVRKLIKDDLILSLADNDDSGRVRDAGSEGEGD